MSDNTVTLTGEVARVKFENDSGTWYVLEIQPDNLFDSPFVCTGSAIGLSEGDTLEMTGIWVKKPQWGLQFEMQSYKKILPKSLSGVKTMMVSMLPYVTYTIASELEKKLKTPEAIYEWLGDIENEGDWPKIKGLGDAKLLKIRDKWAVNKNIADLLEYLGGYGITVSAVTRIYKEWGGGSLDRVKRNPYELTDIHGFGWKRVDSLAQEMGVPVDSPLRVEAGIDEAMKLMASDGHVYSDRTNLIRGASDLLGQSVSRDLIDSVITTACQPVGDRTPKLVDEGGRIYRYRVWFSEVETAEKLKTIMVSDSCVPFVDDWDSLRAEFQSMESERLGIDFILTDEQFHAVKSIFESKVLIITGGAGVGKSTIVKMAVWVARKFHIYVDLAAPTGKAAKRLTEVTGDTAKTIHRLLEAKGVNEFGRNAGNTLESDIIVVDEASMIDIGLAYRLTCAIPNKSHLIFIGDPHQLPSVGAGNVLADIIKSGTVGVCALTEIFRQAAENLIVKNSHKIRQGDTSIEFRTPVFNEHGTLANEQADMFYYDLASSGHDPLVVNNFVAMAMAMGYDMDDIVVLSPMRKKGSLASDALNSQLQEKFNPQKYVGGKPTIPEKVIGRDNYRRVFRVGDKVMQISNNYDVNRFNGMSGKIIDHDFVPVSQAGDAWADSDWDNDSFDKDKKYWWVAMDDDTVHYVADDELAAEFVLAYGMSIHKSQGSEYKVVVLVLTKAHYIMLNRRLAYTGVTRASRMLIVVGDWGGISMAIRQDNPTNRRTSLSDRLSSNRATDSTDSYQPEMETKAEPYSMAIADEVGEDEIPF